MHSIKTYFQLLRVHHYIKNVIIYIPLFFAEKLIDFSLLASVTLGFCVFSLAASIVYIFNDIHDIEKDRLHIKKCTRPLASGKIMSSRAVLILIILYVILVILLFLLKLFGDMSYYKILWLFGLLVLYLGLNIAYSRRLKNFPIIDVTILASGYVIRVLFGSVIIGADVSPLLYLFITTGAYYLGFGKRRNEMVNNSGSNTRGVLRFYSQSFLDKNMYVCQALCIMFYALWSIDSKTTARFQTSAFIYTVPLIFLIFLKYSLNIEKNTDGDPTSVLLNDRILQILSGIYVICAFCIIYFKNSIFGNLYE